MKFPDNCDIILKIIIIIGEIMCGFLFMETSDLTIEEFKKQFGTD